VKGKKANKTDKRAMEMIRERETFMNPPAGKAGFRMAAGYSRGGHSTTTI
jgi:hypothetical protein